MPSIRILAVVLVISTITLSDSARILGVFPVPSISHQVVFRAVTQELVKRGHELVILTPDPVYPNGGGPDNLTEINVHNMSYTIWQKMMLEIVKLNSDTNAQLNTAFKAIFDIFDKQLNTDEVKELINNKTETFDLILAEACIRSTAAFSIRFNAPVIAISSLGALDEEYLAIGAPTHPFLYPILTSKRLLNLTIWEKIDELYAKYLHSKLVKETDIMQNAMIRKHFGDNAPNVEELSKRITMLFLNVNPLWNGNRPVPPSVVYMGGIHLNPIKEIPKDLKNYLDSSKQGVIYISFGSNVNPAVFPEERIKTFTNVLSRLPYNVLWKWNDNVLPDQPSNVKTSKWFPQNDLLRHPNVKLFITQGGLQSTDEAILAGVPLLGVPILGDQFYNVEKYKQLEIGERLDLLSLTEDTLEKTIQKLIHDTSYRKNIVKLSALMQDQPQRPLERAIWWIEHIIRHGGGQHLRSPSANITWSEYLHLDVLLVLGSVAVVSFLVISILLFYIVFSLKRLFSSKIKLKFN